MTWLSCIKGQNMAMKILLIKKVDENENSRLILQKKRIPKKVTDYNKAIQLNKFQPILKMKT
jgi:hypothetical protein